ncbi:unnamed protein product [Rhizophagus irregularis]|uniref:Bromo domain-containing protein n=1 Tax=Rhizophagus irregularis TaxID=588596 RepID=A0A915Z6N2_9GLOM|nr:unnamed protein product [Rhizophagus irregularis]CAB5364745.1 unnamed protein product [Rhizophagus irregularis]
MSTTTTEKYIGYDALVSYLIKSRNSLNEWKNVDIIWYTHYLDEAKRLLEPDDFDTVKKKAITEHSQRKKELKIFWQRIIKKCEKENLVPAVTSIASSVEVSSQPDALLPKKTVNLSEISQLDLSKKNIKLIDFCYDILHELENEFYAHKFNKYIDKDIENKVIKHPISLFTINLKLKNNQYTSLEEFEKDIRLIFHNCYTYNNVESDIYCLGETLESIFKKKWNEKLILQDRQTRELKRVRDNDADDTQRSWKKQIQILEQNKDNLMYRQVVNNALLIASAYESLVMGNILPFIEILKTFLLTRSRMSLSSANESMLQAIVESLLPLKYRIPELSLVMDGKQPKGSGRFGYSDVFILKGIGDNYISLELKYISLIGLISQKVKFGANELENLDKILEKENEEVLLKRQYTYWSKEFKKTMQTTIDDVLNGGISQLKSYMNTISKGNVVNYSNSGYLMNVLKQLNQIQIN